MAVDAHGVPPRLLVTGDAEADCRPAAALTGGFKAGFLLADRASDTDKVLAKAAKVRADAAAIPSRSNRKAQRVIDLHVCTYTDSGTEPGTPSRGSRGGAG